jgi:hypothetical protein
MPNLPRCVLKHRAPLARGPIFLPNIFFFKIDFCLCGAILNLKAFCNILTIPKFSEHVCRLPV